MPIFHKSIVYFMLKKKKKKKEKKVMLEYERENKQRNVNHEPIA